MCSVYMGMQESGKGNEGGEHRAVGTLGCGNIGTLPMAGRRPQVMKRWMALGRPRVLWRMAKVLCWQLRAVHDNKITYSWSVINITSTVWALEEQTIALCPCI